MGRPGACRPVSPRQAFVWGGGRGDWAGPVELLQPKKKKIDCGGRKISQFFKPTKNYTNAWLWSAVRYPLQWWEAVPPDLHIHIPRVFVLDLSSIGGCPHQKKKNTHINVTEGLSDKSGVSRCIIYKKLSDFHTNGYHMLWAGVSGPSHDCLISE